MHWRETIPPWPGECALGRAAWDDVLAHGPASGFARWFDIDWRATDRELRAQAIAILRQLDQAG